MTQIKVYSAAQQSSGSDAAKGTVNNPYTEAEYEAMLEMTHGQVATWKDWVIAVRPSLSPHLIPTLTPWALMTHGPLRIRLKTHGSQMTMKTTRTTLLQVVTRVDKVETPEKQTM